ncbi:hypothetical protein NCCP2495_16000 [Dietzia sp. NCCP-2495]|uniref:WXG100 family type VII secretion target n=1 Tax=Dietzia sp. NCCP-2495 TaxID=2934675 RepID=UPI0022328166|nr:WXG100 family type VII secretion target [Dietzia sp. NCCP-2495]GLB63721.1 hypothetical protein NCCP2495_16000 [Dietzia sp. NCCP-2495]
MIQYDFTKLHQLADDLREELKVLTTQSESLGEEVSTIASAWESPEARDKYLDAQSKWDTEFSDTRTLLNKLANAVETSANDMKGTDTTVGGGF